MILHKDDQETESNGDNESDDSSSQQTVTNTIDNDNGDVGSNDGSDAASTLSSTPLFALKRSKTTKKKSEEKPVSSTAASGKAKKTKDKMVTKTKARTTQSPKNVFKEKTPIASKLIDNKNKTKAKQVPVASTRAQKEKGEQEEKQLEKKGDDGTHNSENEEEEEEACCLCHCGVDCSDRALFFPRDRKSELEEDEDYYFGLDDPYLDGDNLYDRNNALVYCDTCNRLYHQKCHFVPMLVVPRGEFHCLICSIQEEQQQQQKQKQTVQDKKRPSKKRDRKGSMKSLSTQSSAIQEKFLKRKITDQLFQSPPAQSSKTVEIKCLEKEWEIESSPAKARLWDRQLKQLKTFLKSQASNIRMANTTLVTMTSTKRNRQHFLENNAKSGTKSSQELAQTLCKLTGAKFKIREALLSLESLRTKNESIDFSSLYSWCQVYAQHANHVFPFGSSFCKDERRIIPRTRERKQEEEKKQETDCSMPTKCNKKASGIIPNEIVVNSTTTSERPSRSNRTCTSSAVAKCAKSSSHSKRGENGGNDDDDDDNDSGITLDDLQCSICMIGDATDENDVILCDGKDCHRAYHMKCVHPAVKGEDIENEDEDWFCPICSNSAELMGEMHGLCIGDDDDDASSGSWEDVQDVFPGSQWEYETAMKILKGKRNEDTQRLLAMFLGEDINRKQVQMPVGSDSEDENDHSLFDEDSFQERRDQEREDENDGNSDEDDSICSSQATLQEMDGVDYKVGKAELANLSEEEGSEANSDNESETNVRRSRRLGKQKEVEESNIADFGADFDEANIIDGKRNRKRVNYRKLNDMMFGDLSDLQQGIIDGGEDFDATQAKPIKTESDNDSDDDQNNDSD